MYGCVCRSVRLNGLLQPKARGTPQAEQRILEMNLYQDVFFRGLDLLRGRQNMKRLRFLRESQYWDPERLRSWQLEQLNALLEQARSASPFYRERFRDLGLPLLSLSHLQGIPILSKNDISRNKDAMRASNLPQGRFVAARTGGSTGEPMQYFWDKRAMDWNRGSVYRSAEWAGVPHGTRAFQMSGSHFDYAQGQRFFHKSVYFLQRYRDLSVAWVDDELLEDYYQRLLRFKPASIWGYASGITLFARHIETRHPGADLSFVKAILTSSETLGPDQRQQIERAFGPGTVFDNYGSREMYIAAECRAHDGYHLHADVVLTEVVDSDGRACAPGESGRVILTELFNHAFPFVRYEIGDMAVMGEADECACGVRLPRLRSLEGRVAELIVLRDRVLTPPNFATLLSDKPGIRAYQIVQKSIDKLTVFIEPGEGFTDETLEYVRRGMLDLVAGQARVEVVTDVEIEVPESGKRCFVVSEVSLEAR